MSIQHKYSFFLKSRIFIQNKYFFLNPDYSFKKLFIFLKLRIFVQNKYSFFLNGRIAQGYLGEKSEALCILTLFSWKKLESAQKSSLE